jgi:inner membrane protein COX18
MHPLRSITALRPQQAVQLTRLKARHFHSTKPTQFVLDTLLDGSTAVIQGVHTASCLPWVASIPLTALIVRSFVGFPLQFYSRLRAREEKRLQPILSAWNSVLAHETRIKGPQDSKTKKETAKKLQEYTKRIYSTWGVSTRWRPIMFMQIPVFITVMESLRRMSGNNQGIFAWLMTFNNPEEAAATAVSRLEPSFATEGALWFPDLLAGDQTGVLPVLLTASILGNVMAGWKAKPFAELAELPKMQMYREVTFRGLRVFIQVLACQVGLMSFVNELPTALLIYWITSTNIATLQTWILEKRIFSKTTLKPFQRRYVAFERPGDDDPFRLKKLR